MKVLSCLADAEARPKNHNPWRKRGTASRVNVTPCWECQVPDGTPLKHEGRAVRLWIGSLVASAVPRLRHGL